MKRNFCELVNRTCHSTNGMLLEITHRVPLKHAFLYKHLSFQIVRSLYNSDVRVHCTGKGKQDDIIHFFAS